MSSGGVLRLTHAACRRDDIGAHGHRAGQREETQLHSSHDQLTKNFFKPIFASHNILLFGQRFGWLPSNENARNGGK
jgi:hypothetical protein